MPIEEKELINRLKENEESAWRQLFRDHYSALCCLAEAYVGNRYDAESVVSDVMFRLWEIRETLLSNIKLRPYLVTCVKNKCRDVLESKIWQQSKETEGIEESGATLILMDTTPLENLLEKEMEQTVTDAIEALPEDCRRVFKMSRFEDMTREAIAEKLGISINTVKYHLKQAIQILKENIRFYGLSLPALVSIFVI